MGLLPLTIGVAAILLTTVGPLAKSQAEINKVLNIDKNQITKVLIKPTEDREYEKISLTQNTVEVTDKNTIDSLCFSLTKAKETNSIIKNPKWVCLVEFEKMDNSFLEFEVKSAGSDTFIEVKSNGYYGWIYGTLDARHFGQLLVDLSK